MYILIELGRRKRTDQIMKMMVKPQIIILVPYAAHGHVTPMLHLAEALYGHGFKPVVAIPDFMHRRVVSRAGTDDEERVAFVPITGGLSGDGHIDFFAIENAMENYMPAQFERALKALMESEGEVVCVVIDLLASWAVRVAARRGLRVAGFWPAMLATYRVITAIPELIWRGLISDSGLPLNGQEHTKEGEEVSSQLLPTNPKHSTKDLPWLVGNPSSQRSRFEFWLRTMDRAKTLRWLLVNSFPEEDGQLDGSSEDGPHVFQIGSLLSSSSKYNNNNLHSAMRAEDGSCLKWLDGKPNNSVIYVSFGTWVGPIRPEKIAELALALEATGKPFLWVLKDDAPWRSGLPTGFLGRNGGRGKVVSWAPQEAVLGHAAVGCYITHCGWNSTVEAIRHGKRLVCCPISGDQFLNCNFIVRAWGIGIRPEGLGRKAVEDCVARVMEGKEGEEMQERVLGLKERVMGVEGKRRAEVNLQSFVNAIRMAQ